MSRDICGPHNGCSWPHDSPSPLTTTWPRSVAPRPPWSPCTAGPGTPEALAKRLMNERARHRRDSQSRTSRQRQRLRSAGDTRAEVTTAAGNPEQGGGRAETRDRAPHRPRGCDVGPHPGPATPERRLADASARGGKRGRGCPHTGLTPSPGAGPRPQPPPTPRRLVKDADARARAPGREPKTRPSVGGPVHARTHARTRARTHTRDVEGKEPRHPSGGVRAMFGLHTLTRAPRRPRAHGKGVLGREAQPCSSRLVRGHSWGPWGSCSCPAAPVP